MAPRFDPGGGGRCGVVLPHSAIPAQAAAILRGQQLAVASKMRRANRALTEIVPNAGMAQGGAAATEWCEMSWKTLEQAEAERLERAVQEREAGEERGAADEQHRAQGGQVGERRLRRYHAPLEAQLLVDGAPWHCRIHDISVDGAGLDPAIPAALGRKVELRSPHFDFTAPLPGRVVNVASERTCLAFDLDDAAARALTIYLASTVDGK